MKNVLPYIFMMCGLSAWGQTPIQVQTKTGNYDISDAYSITFEDAGRVQVIKSQSQGEVRIPMADLKQIHFNDTAVSLINQIRNLEGCKIMKAILLDEVKDLPADFFWQYLNSPSVTKVLIPNDEALLYIPSASLPLRVSSHECWSAFLGDASIYMRRYSYDPTTGTKGREMIGTGISQTEAAGILKRLILNQMVVGTEFPAYTAAGSEVDFKADVYQGTYQKWALQNEWKDFPEAHVVEKLAASDGKEYMVVDRIVAETCLPTYDALSEIAPKFLELMDVPVQFLLDCGYIDAAHVASVSFFKDVSYNLGYKKFCWTSTRVNYTIFAPTDEAIDAAIRTGDVYTWQMIQNDPSNALEKIAKTMAFIKRHICFGNVLIDVPEGGTVSRISCNLLPNGTAQRVSVERRTGSDEFLVNNVQSVPSSIRYVRDPLDPWEKRWNDSERAFTNQNSVTGVVMQINQAIVEEY